MENITDIKLSNKTMQKPNKELIDSSINHNSRNIQKFTSSLFSNSNQNITPSLLHNYSTPKFLIRKSLQKKNTNNLQRSLDLNNNSDNDTFNDLNIIKEEFAKKGSIKNILSDKLDKHMTSKIKLSKNNERTGAKKSVIIPREERQIKSPRTIFQKIIINLDKLKIRTNKTIEVMRKNLKITRNEIKKRIDQEKQIQSMSLTYMQNLGDKKNKRKKNNITNFKFNKTINNSYRKNLYIKYNKNKSVKNIITYTLIIINTTTINNNQSISNGSTSMINYINEAGGYNTNNINNIKTNIINNNVSFSSNNNSEKNALNKKVFSQTGKNTPKIKNKNKKDELDSEDKMKLIKIPELNLSTITSTRAVKPLFPIDKYKKVYKNMYHLRNLDFSLTTIRKQLYKIYGMPALLMEQQTFNSENEMNTLLINNKIRLIQDNIEYFKINIMYRNEFLEAFNNMESFQKAEFNLNLEEISCTLIKTIPLILQNYFETIRKLISFSVPNIKQESLKKPESESQCLNINYAFFNSSIEYFNICLQVYHILSLKLNRFIYSITDFGPLNSYLDIIRFCTNNIISVSSAFINKTKGDKKLLEKIEGNLNIKKEEKEKIDFLERYHKRHRKQPSEWELKIQRVNRALNIQDKSNKNENKKPWKKIKIKDSSVPKKVSAFNSPIFRSMLKYFKPEIKSKIIAFQVMERYEMKKNELNKYQDEEDNEDGNSRKIFA